MSNPFKTQKFKDEFQKWNDILEESGHEEIEDFSLPDPPLKRWHALDFKKVNIELYTAKQEYYARARDLLHTYPFKTALHKKVWYWHSEGVPVRTIAEALKQPKLRKSTVFNIIDTISKQIKK